jgi:hypothetical protein
MARRTNPESTYVARRDAIRAVIIESRALDPDVAERWCDAWEAEAALQGVDRGDREFWQTGKHWIEAQCAARKKPPN